MKKRYLHLLAAALVLATAHAQRPTDRLDRGLVAVSSGSGYLLSWRIFGEEYYNTRYNLYRNGVKVNDEPLRISNYLDNSGSSTAQYQVAAVVNGVEQEKCKTVVPWTAKDVNGNPYYEFNVKSVTGRDGADATSNYTLNDISLGDVDGDGVSEFIVKRNSGNAHDTANKTTFHMLECYNIKGARLWYIDLGPNMLSGADEQYDIVFYDWDGDGRAEGLLRGADNMIIHTADGTSINIGDMNVDTRWNGIEYTSTGAEYLLYLDGETGVPYQIGPTSHPNYMDYPLTRGLDSDWGTGIIGHRSTKHYFGAPFLDGRHASIFLGRGAYTKHKMAAFDVNPITHQLTQRWYWTSDGLDSSWFGNGYHNYSIADVDMDGRDEIAFGSMVIDDNGKGLSTTGLGHGDAQHTTDLDPYRKGLEFFGCNETSPNMNYRNSTTSEIYFRSQGSADDGRALIGNFSDKYPGSLGRSVNTGMFSSVADREIPNSGADIAWSDLNFRIYWDGDLLDEVLNSPGTEREAKIEKPGTGRIFTSWGCQMNNWSKNNPGAQGDILGDWREEIILRANGNTSIRIYTTPHVTSYRIPTLWHDHQYRQAMVWQSIGYNQPPHKSYFLGAMEGLTVAPPPLTNTGRTEILNGGSISTAHNGLTTLVAETNDTHVSIAAGANPAVAVFNVPSWTQGSNNNKAITTLYYTCTVSGDPLTGETRLVKQGEGTLVMPKGVHAYTGNTDVWGGTLSFDGQLPNSYLWLNRFAKLNSNGGAFRSIHADYAAEIRPGGEGSIGELSADTLDLGFGSRVVFDINGEAFTSDAINVKTLIIRTQNWEYGPKYNTPVFEFVNASSTLAEGRYALGSVGNIASGSLSSIRIEGLTSTRKISLELSDGQLFLVVEGLRPADSVVWKGQASTLWDLASSTNFTLASNPSAESIFVTGDKVRFDDTASQFSVQLNSELIADSVIVDNTTDYSFAGKGTIAGLTTLVKRGTGRLTISNDNTYTGGTRISGGTIIVSSLSNATQAYGNLGGLTTTAPKFIIENGATLLTTANVNMGSPIQILSTEGGVINNAGDFIVNKPIYGTTLIKRGTGWMKLNVANPSLQRIVISSGTLAVISDNNISPAQTVEIAGGTLSDVNGEGSYSNYTYNVEVPEGKSGTWNLDGRATYNNRLTGAGTLTVNNQSTIWRTQLQGNWSAFTGVIKTKGSLPLDNTYGLPNAELSISEGDYVNNVGNRTFAIGKLSGTGYLSGATSYAQGGASGVVTWQIGNADNWTFSGNITSTCAIVKTGAGKVTLAGKANNYTGLTRVEQGELHFNSGVSLGTGPLTVNSGAILSGVTGAGESLANSSYTINGTLQVGLSATTASGVIDFGGKNVTFSNGSTLKLNIRRGATTISTGGASIQGIATLTMYGAIDLGISSSYSLAVGDSVILWKVDKLVGTPTLSSDVIDAAAGLYWDTRALARGVLYVTDVAPVGISNVSADTPARVEVVDASGTTLMQFRCRLNEAESHFRASQLPTGVYMLRIHTAQGSQTRKLMK